MEDNLKLLNEEDNLKLLNDEVFIWIEVAEHRDIWITIRFPYPLSKTFNAREYFLSNLSFKVGANYKIRILAALKSYGVGLFILIHFIC